MICLALSVTEKGLRAWPWATGTSSQYPVCSVEAWPNVLSVLWRFDPVSSVLRGGLSPYSVFCGGLTLYPVFSGGLTQHSLVFCGGFTQCLECFVLGIKSQLTYQCSAGLTLCPEWSVEVWPDIECSVEVWSHIHSVLWRSVPNHQWSNVNTTDCRWVYLCVWVRWGDWSSDVVHWRCVWLDKDQVQPGLLHGPVHSAHQGRNAHFGHQGM